MQPLTATSPTTNISIVSTRVEHGWFGREKPVTELVVVSHAAKAPPKVVSVASWPAGEMIASSRWVKTTRTPDGGDAVRQAMSGVFDAVQGQQEIGTRPAYSRLQPGMTYVTTATEGHADRTYAFADGSVPQAVTAALDLRDAVHDGTIETTPETGRYAGPYRIPLYDHALHDYRDELSARD